MQDVSCVISRRGQTILAYAEVLRELNLFEYQRVTKTDEINIIRANYIHLCAEISPEKLLSADKK